MSNKEKNALLNAVNLYNNRNKIIKLFESKDITLLCMRMMQNLME